MNKGYPKYLFILLIVLFGLFYWYEIRPAQVRKGCQALAYERGNEYFYYDFIKTKPALEKSMLQEEYMQRYYERCLHEKGLE